MWRRTYLLLVLVRLYFALSASYLHPDENFQGPEVIAGQIFSYPVKLTWEFTAAEPIRSVFPLWPIYGLPMLLLKWLWIGKGGDGDIPPAAVFWTLRLLMFFLSFVFEDWAIHELVASPRHRKVAVVLVASSYVTWTYQTHTFSNSVETLLVAWSLVLIQRILDNQRRSCTGASAILAALVVFGIFNRITFPAFICVPALRLIPHVFRKYVAAPDVRIGVLPLIHDRPFSLVSMILSAAVVTALAIVIDTNFYSNTPLTWSGLLKSQTITPLNNYRYNRQTENLVAHGLHPWYQHLINLGLLLGPALILVLHRPQLSLSSPLLAVIPGVAVLSFLPHQEARFLLPVIPLVLSSVSLPKNRLHLRVWATAWIAFNAALGILMGMYHQAGIVPTQIFMSGVGDATHAVWWKTYSPPIWLLNGKNEVLTTHDTMGISDTAVMGKLQSLVSCPSAFRGSTSKQEGVYFVAPLAAKGLQRHVDATEPKDKTSASRSLSFERVWLHRRHLNLDDLDFAEDGIWPTLKRVIGRRGLGVWKVTKICG